MGSVTGSDRRHLLATLREVNRSTDVRPIDEWHSPGGRYDRLALDGGADIPTLIAPLAQVGLYGGARTRGCGLDASLGQVPGPQAP
jgi:hypothetical protein